jgi:hypothetical protein
LKFADDDILASGEENRGSGIGRRFTKWCPFQDVIPAPHGAFAFEAFSAHRRPDEIYKTTFGILQHILYIIILLLSGFGDQILV